MGDNASFKFFRLMLETWLELEDDKLRADYFVALAKYWLDWEIPTDPIIKALLKWAMYSIDKNKTKNKKISSSMKGNSNAVKNFENIQKQLITVEDSWTQSPSRSIEDIEIKEKEISKDISKKKSDTFETFWKEYPHARKWKKQESEKYFTKQNSDEVMKQVAILKRKLRAWLEESKRIPACERWIRDFTPLNEDVIRQDLIKICKRHLNAWWDMKERSMELKQTFWEQQINEIVKAIQQKDSPKNLFIKQTN